MKKRKFIELSSSEWVLLRTLEQLPLEEIEKKMSVEEWRRKKIKELKDRGGVW